MSGHTLRSQHIVNMASSPRAALPTPDSILNYADMTLSSTSLYMPMVPGAARATRPLRNVNELDAAMTTATSQRKALHAYLSDDAHVRWHRFAAQEGVSVSALLEALAPELDPASTTAAAPLRDRLAEVVAVARRTDASRRRRRR